MDIGDKIGYFFMVLIILSVGMVTARSGLTVVLPGTIGYEQAEKIRKQQSVYKRILGWYMFPYVKGHRIYFVVCFELFWIQGLAILSFLLLCVIGITDDHFIDNFDNFIKYCGYVAVSLFLVTLWFSQLKTRFFDEEKMKRDYEEYVQKNRERNWAALDRTGEHFQGITEDEKDIVEEITYDIREQIGAICREIEENEWEPDDSMIERLDQIYLQLVKIDRVIVASKWHEKPSTINEYEFGAQSSAEEFWVLPSATVEHFESAKNQFIQADVADKQKWLKKMQEMIDCLHYDVCYCLDKTEKYSYYSAVSMRNLRDVLHELIVCVDQYERMAKSIDHSVYEMDDILHELNDIREDIQLYASILDEREQIWEEICAEHAGKMSSNHK